MTPIADDFDAIAHAVLARLTNAAIAQDPFPHVVVADAFPSHYYSRVLQLLPPTSEFGEAEYPGTGRFTQRHGGTPTEGQGAQHVGRVLGDWGVLEPLRGFLAGDAFARVLLDKFSAIGSRGPDATAIPREKHAWFTGTNREYECVFELYRDLASYEISPHSDNPAKIVTFLWYLSDESPTRCGTLLCREKQGRTSAPMRAGYARARQDGRAGLWLDWEDFDVVKDIGGPNVFLAFAPNEISFHGVRMPTGADVEHERTVVRGFVARRGYRDTTVLKATAPALTPLRHQDLRQ